MHEVTRGRKLLGPMLEPRRPTPLYSRPKALILIAVNRSGTFMPYAQGVAMGFARNIFDQLKETYQEWKDDDAQTWAASVTFYTVFSLAPLLVLAVAIAGFVFGEEAASGELAGQVETMVGPAGAEVVQTTIASATGPGSSKGILATIISLVLLFLGASKVFAELQKALNRIWDVRTDPDAGWRGLVRKRIAGFAMVLGVGLLLILALAASAILSGIEQIAGNVVGGPWLWEGINFIASIAIIGLVFAALFKYVPDVEIEWRDVWFGAALTALLFTIGKFALGIYLAHGNLGSGYGAASSLVILLAWIYYSAQIFFMGAEFTQVRAHRRGHEIRPDSHAIPLDDQRGALGGAQPSPG
jgi:membrane protein